ncbi:MAG: glycosyltransferase family 1 protein, partial [bacterium]|nr:glycosyltransferase family 1 protein [bacterium]
PAGREQLDRTLTRYRITKPYILYVGMLKSHKNIKRLIAAFEKAQTGLKDKYALVIAGDTKTDQDNLPEWISREKIGSTVLLTGYVPAGDLSALYTGAKTFVFPSLAEGFGMPPLEAMSYGIPVAASNASCLPEILGDAPCYFDPYSVDDMAAKLVISCTKDAWRAQAIQKGHRVAARYDWRQTAVACIEVYRSVLGKEL